MDPRHPLHDDALDGAQAPAVADALAPSLVRFTSVGVTMAEATEAMRRFNSAGLAPAKGFRMAPIKRRTFVSRTLALLGLGASRTTVASPSATPGFAEQLAAKGRGWREAVQQAALGLAPGEARFQTVLRHRDDGLTELQIYIDCHGETHARAILFELCEPPPSYLAAPASVIVTPDGIRFEEGVPVQEASATEDSIKALRLSRNRIA